MLPLANQNQIFQSLLMKYNANIKYATGGEYSIESENL